MRCQNQHEADTTAHLSWGTEIRHCPSVPWGPVGSWTFGCLSWPWRSNALRSSGWHLRWDYDQENLTCAWELQGGPERRLNGHRLLSLWEAGRLWSWLRGEKLQSKVWPLEVTVSSPMSHKATWVHSLLAYISSPFRDYSNLTTHVLQLYKGDKYHPLQTNCGKEAHSDTAGGLFNDTFTTWMSKMKGCFTTWTISSYVMNIILSPSPECFQLFTWSVHFPNSTADNED